MLGRLVTVLGKRFALKRQMAAQSFAHAGVGDPVRRMDDGRRKAARELVFSAGARFEAAQALAQAIGCLLYTSRCV